MRHPVVAGSFYPADVDSLLAMLEEFVKRNPQKDVIAGVAPHAGYIYSGRTAGKLYSIIPEAETYVIIGPNHTGYGSMVAVSTDTWLTPLGEVKTDKEFIDAMPGIIVDRDEIAHRGEHSIEVQLPFLQYICDDFEIVPICMGLQDEETAREVAGEILVAQERTDRDIVVIASSDMHHYLPDDVCRERDAKVIEAILSMDVFHFYLTVNRLQASVCGVGPIAVSMIYSKSKQAYAELVNYSTSGDVADKSQVVGYAAIAFRI